MSVTDAERAILRTLVAHGGRHGFRPQDQSQLAWAVFDREIVQVLQSLEARGFLQIDEQASHRIGSAGREGKYASIVAKLTELGRPWAQ
jgi:hypothetical protein